MKIVADKKKKPKKKPDGRGSRPRDPNQLALWIIQQSTSNRSDPPRDARR